MAPAMLADHDGYHEPLFEEYEKLDTHIAATWPTKTNAPAQSAPVTTAALPQSPTASAGA